MKLSEHVDKLRNLIEAAFDKHFARLGIGKNKQLDIEKLPVEVRSKRLRFEEMLESHIGETGDYEHAREKLIDELTFTLFNRLAAVKVMEAAALFPPVLTKQPEHGDRSFGHKAWLEMNPHMRSEELEGIREYLKTAFDELGETLPLYSKAYPYALLPDAISLNEIIDAFNAVEKDSQVGSDIWQSDDVLGWMYESYNNVKKKAHKDSGDKTEYNKVSLQSQVYTPRWVVQFLVENSLGKLYLEMHPDSEIKRRYKIANAPQTQERKPKPMHEVKAIGPACGSGNFLLYAFDFFYELYVDQIDNYGADYEEKEIPKLIIENNLHGIDLDDRAVQLAQLGLFIKAKKKRRTIGELAFNVVSSDFYLPEYEAVEHIFTEGTTLDKSQQELIAEIWNDLQYAYKFGSLIRLDEKVKAKLKMLEAKQSSAQPELFAAMEIAAHKDFAATFFTNLKTAVEQYAQAQGSTFLTSKTRDAITFLELLTTEYDVATANPPYTDSADFGPELKEFIEDNYKKPYKFHTNLYATFIKRCFELSGEHGKVAMIHPRTFMFIKTFEDVRKFMIDKTHINVFVDYSLSNLFGTIMVDPAFYVLEKGVSKDRDAWFVSLDQYTRTPNEKYKKDFCLQALDDYISGTENEHNYAIPQSKLKIIKSWPFIYWISDEFREKFGTKGFGEFFNAGGGLTSANNDRFLRFWWEVDSATISESIEDELKWRMYVKGGPFNKWYGNIWTIVNWGNNGHEIRTFCDAKGKPRATMRSEKFYFKEGMTYAKAGSKGASFRYMPPNTIIDSGSPGIYTNVYENLSYGTAFLNSTLVFYILGCLNPTVSTQVGDVERVPFVIPPKNLEREVQVLAENCIQAKKHLCTFSICEKIFRVSPIFNQQANDVRHRIKQFFNYENHLLTQVLVNETIINEKIFEVYDLTEQDKAMVLAKEGESVGGLPVLAEARTEYLEFRSQEIGGNAKDEAILTSNFQLLDSAKEFIEALPTKEFTTEEREAIESGFGSLYQSNNDLEEFCIRHQVNPINVWYWFKQSNVIPQQRMHTLAMEFLADIIREILMEDEDGIIPLVPNAGEKVLLDRIEEKFREKGFSSAQYSSFDSVLGRPIHEYLNKYFFAELSDHLNLFMYLPKTPFIWHLSSGPEQGFDCYIIIYKWSRDKLMRLRSVYIEHRERSLVNRQSDLSGNESADAQNEKDRIFRQLKEIEAFKAKIDELLAEGYNPTLDDGVGKNIAPLQKKKMIPYEVLNAGQLKKYLNADW
ncbi:BREX-1 system adenine-specific DNA-methyltransferase PglX [Prosthecochloris sp. HL-130-GSB]|uniref:BREX-1 system adenine-specific DNA-methyltransferase PglX n=1 Tax=Prosthecochloris sp. HL-130-GSB TaxID=1974213 RepID=UPI000A1C025F|nr:BREX-1 system adenine-specific DNA-methyltransferase PglX [Prosthecochloris sp. HL-130-GSB]ARM31171.1 restriction endonuclease [Prosthecochloris sp. HL-130-GSB]